MMDVKCSDKYHDELFSYHKSNQNLKGLSWHLKPNCVCSRCKKRKKIGNVLLNALLQGQHAMTYNGSKHKS